mgnify:CR=1 FL=1
MYQVMRKRVGDYETHYFVVDLAEGLPESGLSIGKPHDELKEAQYQAARAATRHFKKTGDKGYELVQNVKTGVWYVRKRKTT